MCKWRVLNSLELLSLSSYHGLHTRSAVGSRGLLRLTVTTTVCNFSASQVVTVGYRFNQLYLTSCLAFFRCPACPVCLILSKAWLNIHGIQSQTLSVHRQFSMPSALPPRSATADPGFELNLKQGLQLFNSLNHTTTKKIETQIIHTTWFTSWVGFFDLISHVGRLQAEVSRWY